MSQPLPAVTIRDVAAAAQVGITTVSRALNNQSGISPATRARILQVAKDLHYQPNRHAQNLRSQNINNIAVVMKGPSNPFFLSLIDPLEQAIRAHGYQMSLLRVPHEADEVNIGRGAYQDSEAAGVLFLGGEARESTAIFNNFPLPFTLCTVPPAPAWDNSVAAVSVDEAHGISLIVSHLTDLGHRQIARVGGPESLAHSYIRDSAFADVASELGMRYRCLHTDYTPETGREATKRLLAFSEHPTAIIYDNDVMALAGLGVAASQGIKVPEEISIMSWDDSLMCTAAYPNLTAMGRDVVDTGKQAAGLLLKLIGGERVGHLMEGPYELRARASTGPAPAAE